MLRPEIVEEIIMHASIIAINTAFAHFWIFLCPVIVGWVLYSLLDGSY